MAETDYDLIARTAQGDRLAFAALYDRLAPRVLGLVFRILRNRTEADDVLQETFLQMWGQAARFDPARSAPDVWALMIARSRALDRLRRRAGPASAAELPEPAAFDEPGRDLERAESAGMVRDALKRLPAEQAEPIRLAFFLGLTHEQIATKLRVPLGTVKTRIRLGMIRLRDQFARPLAEGTVS